MTIKKLKYVRGMQFEGDDDISDKKTSEIIVNIIRHARSQIITADV